MKHFIFFLRTCIVHGASSCILRSDARGSFGQDQKMLRVICYLFAIKGLLHPASSSSWLADFIHQGKAGRVAGFAYGTLVSMIQPFLTPTAFKHSCHLGLKQGGSVGQCVYGWLFLYQLENDPSHLSTECGRPHQSDLRITLTIAPPTSCRSREPSRIPATILSSPASFHTLDMSKGNPAKTHSMNTYLTNAAIVAKPPIRPFPAFSTATSPPIGVSVPKEIQLTSFPTTHQKN
jgi:hypothetical protein